jgi:hypothetical protein
MLLLNKLIDNFRGHAAPKIQLCHVLFSLIAHHIFIYDTVISCSTETFPYFSNAFTSLCFRDSIIGQLGLTPQIQVFIHPSDIICSQSFYIISSDLVETTIGPVNKGMETIGLEIWQWFAY